jgi:chemotaxis-related protein WspD
MSDDPANQVSRSGLNDCWNRIGVRGDSTCPELERHVHCRNCPVYSSAAARLLDAALPAGHLETWTAHFARPPAASAAEVQSWMLFRIGAEWLALPTSVFQEVAALRAIHSLPHRRNGIVLGLANVRGQLLVCVSLATVLGSEALPAKDKASAAQRRLLVIGTEGGRLVFPVDEVHGVQRVATAELQPVPATVAKATATYTQAVFTWEKKTVGCLDAQLLGYTLNRSLA